MTDLRKVPQTGSMWNVSDGTHHKRHEWHRRRSYLDQRSILHQQEQHILSIFDAIDFKIRVTPHSYIQIFRWVLKKNQENVFYKIAVSKIN